MLAQLVGVLALAHFSRHHVQGSLDFVLLPLHALESAEDVLCFVGDLGLQRLKIFGNFGVFFPLRQTFQSSVA